MKNIFADKILAQTSENLTQKDVEIRRKFAPIIHPFIKAANKKKIIVEEYPKLEKDEVYIFAAGHSFPDEIGANLSAIDRHAYTLMGTTDQIINNPKMAILYLYGMIRVNKLDPSSRRDSFLQMKKVLEYGSSIMLFPEGVLNNSENLLCENPYPGVYHLCDETGKKVVPIVSQTYNDSKIIRFRASDPIDLSKYYKQQALDLWRDEIARLRYEMMEKEPILKRELLVGDIHQQYMESRRDTYREVKWTKDVWDEEIMYRKEKGYTNPSEAIEYVDDIDITAENARIIAPVLVRRREYQKYNFKQYMHDNWNK